MVYSSWDRKALSRPEFNPPTLDDKKTFQDIEELVFPLMFVPMKLSFHDPEPNDTVIHPGKRLVIPGVFAFINEGLDIHKLKRGEEGIQVYRVG